MKKFNELNLDKEDKEVWKLLKTAADCQSPEKAFKDKLLLSLAEKYYSDKTVEEKNKKAGIFDAIFQFIAYSAKMPALVASFVIILIGFGATGSYAYLSSSVTRSHSLYGLKRGIESIEYKLAFSEESKLEKQLHFAGKRKDELQKAFDAHGELDESAVKEIVSNLDNAYRLSKNIQNKGLKEDAQIEIAGISKDIIRDLNAIVQEIEKDKVKVKVKKDQVSEVKKDLEDIESSSPVCVDECEEKQKECFGEGYRICGNFDDDKCSEFGNVNICVEGTACKSGNCEPLCLNECQDGERKEMEGDYRICGNFDQDQCLEWSEVNLYEPKLNPIIEPVSPEPAQPVKTEIKNPEPIVEPFVPLCQNECQTSGDRTCRSNGFAICGDYDSDPCLEWSEVNLCALNSTCQNGICKIIYSEPSCVNECETESTRACFGSGYKICGNFDADSCLEYGELNECPEGISCQLGSCY